jgi:hypothetical protein
LHAINSMRKIRKLEINRMSEEKLVQLKLYELQELIISEQCTFIVYNLVMNQTTFWNRLHNWRTFTTNHSRLEVLHMRKSKVSIELLQITLENLPLLKSLELTVARYNFAFIERFNNNYLAQYKKEQMEKVAKLFGENYGRFKHLLVRILTTVDGKHMANYLKKNYPNVQIEYFVDYVLKK